VSFGPKPWRQAHWDARAATNFMAGGAGSGLAFFGALLAAFGAPPAVWAACLVAGVALVGAGLTAVWFEIGRPLRAFNVVFNPRSSWMTREAMIAPLLVACAFALWATHATMFAAFLAAFALGFAYAQGRMLHAARGIPAWNDALVPPWIVVTGLVEGAGLALALAVWLTAVSPWFGVALAAAALVRALLWRAYRRHVAATIVAAAARALDAAGRRLDAIGTAPPVLLAVAAFALPGAGGLAQAAVLAAAGLLAWLGGWSTKFALVRRAAFNRGFSIAHLPVRGRC